MLDCTELASFRCTHATARGDWDENVRLAFIGIRTSISISISINIVDTRNKFMHKKTELFVLLVL